MFFLVWYPPCTFTICHIITWQGRKKSHLYKIQLVYFYLICPFKHRNTLHWHLKNELKKASKMTLSNLKHSFIIKCMDRIKPPLRQTSYPIQYHSCLTALSKHLCLWLLPQSFLCISVFPKTWFFKSFDVKLSFHIHKSLSNFLDQDVLFINFICINHTMNGQYESWLQIVRSHYYS